MELLTWASSIAGEGITSALQVGSNEINQVFRLTVAQRDLFLKTGPNLRREFERLQWLHGRLPCPEPIGFTTRGDTDTILMTAVPGKDLADLKATWPLDLLITRLAAALQTMHATPIDDWPFENRENGTVLVHGDACLPNFVYRGDDLSGYIDLGDLAVDTPETDLAAAVWSLQYNLGPGHGGAFLSAYGWPSTDAVEVERLRQMYETD